MISRGVNRARPTVVATVVATFALAGLPPADRAAAQGLQWRLVAPEPPPAGATGEAACPDGEEPPCAGAPLELGRVGDIEFASPNRGLLMTAGNGNTVPPGIWEYNGASWHELAEVCGASDGRIAWAGPEEFWTVSNGRPGQPANGQGLLPPLEDNTLCHFAPNPSSGALEVVRSYAAPAFQASSYQPMDAAACTSRSDCWFGGQPLPAPQPGAFNLHWNGSALEADTNVAAHSVQDIRAFEGRLIESVSLPQQEVRGKDETDLEALHPFVFYDAPSEAAGAGFEGLRPSIPGHPPTYLPEYAPGSFPAALAGMLMATEAQPDGKKGESLWAAAGPAATPPLKSEPGALTVLRYAGGVWTQVLGAAPTESPTSLGAAPAGLAEDVVTSIAGEPDSSSAWLALDTPLDLADPSPSAPATLLHVQADGSSSEEQLPSAAEQAEGVPPQGAAASIACPARNDCWLATTRGTLFHLSEASTQTIPLDPDRAFAEPASPVAYRPPDEGLPQAASSGSASADAQAEAEAQTPAYQPPRLTQANETIRVPVAAYSDPRTKILHRDTLELSFRLTVRSRVRLLAQRHKRVVASTPSRVLAAGPHALRLRLDPHRWPTQLKLQVHPLAPLPTVAASRSLNTITTSLRAPYPAGLGAAELQTEWLRAAQLGATAPRV